MGVVVDGDDRTSDRGAILVEFALVVPLLLMLLVGIIEFGRAYNTQVALQGAAREGARALALGEDPGPVVLDAAGGITMAISKSTACPAGNPTTASASVTTSTLFTFGIPFIPIGDKTLSATASMRCGL